MSLKKKINCLNNQNHDQNKVNINVKFFSPQKNLFPDDFFYPSDNFNENLTEKQTNKHNKDHPKILKPIFLNSKFSNITNNSNNNIIKNSLLLEGVNISTNKSKDKNRKLPSVSPIKVKNPPLSAYSKKNMKLTQTKIIYNKENKEKCCNIKEGELFRETTRLPLIDNKKNKYTLTIKQENKGLRIKRILSSKEKNIINNQKKPKTKLNNSTNNLHKNNQSFNTKNDSLNRINYTDKKKIKPTKKMFSIPRPNNYKSKKAEINNKKENVQKKFEKVINDVFNNLPKDCVQDPVIVDKFDLLLKNIESFKKVVHDRAKSSCSSNLKRYKIVN